jgi:adenylate cyclase
MLARARFLQLAELKASDRHFQLRGRVPTSQIILLVMDQKSLDAFPELLAFWHPYYAEAIHAAKTGGAKVLGLDVSFGVPVAKWQPENDQILAEAVSSTASEMPVICGYVPAMLSKQRDWPVPVNLIASALGLSAYSNLTVDSDDFVRSQELLEGRSSDPSQPVARSMALRVAEKFLASEAEFDGSRLSLAGHPIPITPDRAMRINYAGPPGTFPRVSLVDFIHSARSGNVAQLKQWVQGKVVLLGPDYVEDRHATPFYSFFAGPRWNTAGVEIVANTIETILNRNYLVPAPPAVSALILLLLTGVTVVIASSATIGRSLLSLGGLAGGAAAASQIAFQHGILFPIAEPLVGGVIALLAASAFRFLTAEKRGALFHDAVSMFVGKHVAQSLDKSQKISLSAVRLPVTILFSDIRGFTAFCEDKDPEVLVEVLNEYLANMVSIIVSHHGHVNKFLGDGILAVFSDMDGTTACDHACRAVRCGIEMVQNSGEFRTGVGMASGEAVVGNIGSADKMEYTVLGDVVNLASRLESLNKEQHTKLLFSGTTLDLLTPDIDVLPVGSIPVRGKVVPVKVFTVAALAPEHLIATVENQAS